MPAPRRKKAKVRVNGYWLLRNEQRDKYQRRPVPPSVTPVVKRSVPPVSPPVVTPSVPPVAPPAAPPLIPPAAPPSVPPSVPPAATLVATPSVPPVATPLIPPAAPPVATPVAPPAATPAATPLFFGRERQLWRQKKPIFCHLYASPGVGKHLWLHQLAQVEGYELVDASQLTVSQLFQIFCGGFWEQVRGAAATPPRLLFWDLYVPELVEAASQFLAAIQKLLKEQPQRNFRHRVVLCTQDKYGLPAPWYGFSQTYPKLWYSMSLRALSIDEAGLFLRHYAPAEAPVWQQWTPEERRLCYQGDLRVLLQHLRLNVPHSIQPQDTRVRSRYEEVVYWGRRFQSHYIAHNPLSKRQFNESWDLLSQGIQHLGGGITVSHAIESAWCRQDLEACVALCDVRSQMDVWDTRTLLSVPQNHQWTAPLHLALLQSVPLPARRTTTTWQYQALRPTYQKHVLSEYEEWSRLQLHIAPFMGHAENPAQFFTAATLWATAQGWPEALQTEYLVQYVLHQLCVRTHGDSQLEKHWTTRLRVWWFNRYECFKKHLARKVVTP
jgi:hypothetical protein